MVTTGGRLPLLRDRITSSETYVAGSPPIKRPLPSRIPSEHGKNLLDQLAALKTEAATRPVGARNEMASREIVAIVPHADGELNGDSLVGPGDHLVGTDPDTGIVIIDASSAQLEALRKKVEIYADDASPDHKLRDDGTIKRSREAIVAPIEQIHFARVNEVSGERLRIRDVDPRQSFWFEVGCRGGYRSPDETRASRSQLFSELQKRSLLDPTRLPELYEAADRAYFFLRLTHEQLTSLVAAVDCVYDLDFTPPVLRDLFLFDDQQTGHNQFVLHAAPNDAPSVVVVDTGIASGHPMLGAALLPGAKAEHLASSEDEHGHGTKMAGLALYPDVGAAYEARLFTATHWIQSARLLVRPGQGAADDEYRQAWPRYTQEAIEGAELSDSRDRNRVFALAITRSMQVAPDVMAATTLSSLAIDGLAFAHGHERLIVVSAGNSRDERWLALAQQFPAAQLTEKVHDPSQAANALTVGAYTSRVVLPADRAHAEARAVAQAPGGISPYTSCGVIGSGWPLKPDVVMEGGNLAMSSQLTDAQVPTLSSLTTNRRFTLGQPLGYLSMTSEATARAARLAANIWTLEPNLRPTTVRGLIVHAASWTQEMTRQFPGLNDRLCACGYGVPNEAFARECATDRATIIVEDEMPNLEIEQVLRDEPPKRPSTPATKPVKKRRMKFYRLQLPDDLGTTELVELRVTLSFFPEPHKYRKRTYYGLELKWDMQGPHELEAQFLERVNHDHRPPDPARPGKRLPPTTKTESFDWDIGPQLRGRGTVQSDRWCGRAADLAGSKLIAVIPIYGWWDDRKDLEFEKMKFSLLVTIRSEGIYDAIKQRIEQPIEVDLAT